jgi:hypothetical protein
MPVMAEHRTKEPGAGEEPPTSMTVAQFESTPEFRRLKTGMKQLLKVSKEDLDCMVLEARNLSSRVDNPNAPGRKKAAP